MDLTGQNVAETSVEEYWTKHNVTLHQRFADAASSLEYLHWRNGQYYGYAQLMPTNVEDNLSILDFGCGPGHDLVGFGVMSKPRRLVGVDVSASSLSEAEARLALHKIPAELVRIDIEQNSLPFEDGAFDIVHTSGVLHHMAAPEKALREFRRILKPGGRARIMVYNRDSIWFHLYVPFVLQIEQGQFEGLSPEDAFRRSTDGPDCPISRAYSKESFQSLVEPFGFKLVEYGSAVAAWEMMQLPKRHAAVLNQRTPRENREFLTALHFDEFGLPVSNGHRAGVDGCYLFEAI
ncbi:class I SAM-dependent methyltransferase [Bradyrhizobium sp. sBnM-33]|uniref:class I SAM-dependent methyltransferase n=1 Tax=Bradyrhizobium sp. sBnM-33 TaxID=2831780 RepID=UPI001BCAD4A9|nr:class I SAM-dependent methyltransferase [Bradyrhizobium sp. sBnM-33]WOH48842.1 class I SAM-dependent methyltransferase [Bradyrhizobium sp. sBnM-33]